MHRTRGRFARAVELVDPSRRATRFLGKVSGGTKQIVVRRNGVLILALLQRPHVLDPLDRFHVAPTLVLLSRLTSLYKVRNGDGRKHPDDNYHRDGNIAGDQSRQRHAFARQGPAGMFDPGLRFVSANDGGNSRQWSETEDDANQPKHQAGYSQSGTLRAHHTGGSNRRRIHVCRCDKSGGTRGQANSKLQARIVLVLVRRSRPRKKLHGRWKRVWGKSEATIFIKTH